MTLVGTAFGLPFPVALRRIVASHQGSEREVFLAFFFVGLSPANLNASYRQDATKIFFFFFILRVERRSREDRVRNSRRVIPIPSNAFRPLQFAGHIPTLNGPLLRHLKWTHCLVYLDDVAIFADSFESHLERLGAVLEALQLAGLKLNRNDDAKCVFASRALSYLGHMIDDDGIRPDPWKLEAIDKFATPTDVTSLKSFLGLASYYRRFVPGFVRLAWPLH